jgi:hypothetical protein
MSLSATLDHLGQRQFGLVTSRQLADLGFTTDQVRLLVASGRLVRVRRGVYRLLGVETTWQSVAFAAVLAGGVGAVLSHRSGGVLWGLLDRHGETGPMEIVAPRARSLGGVTVHHQRLVGAEVTRRQGIPVTSAERTLLDLAATTPASELGRLCDEGLRRRIVTLGRLHAVVDGHGGGGRRRLEPIQAVLADRIPGYEPGANDWERGMDRMWDRLGLPAAERQYRLQIGRRTYCPDRAIVDLKIAVDWNGFDLHGRRGNFDRDSDRRAALAAAGWYPLDFTSRSRPEVICRAVLAVVAERRELFGRAS